MCGMNMIGGGVTMPPMKPAADAAGGGSTVAGATGGGDTAAALPTGGADLGAVLLQLTKSVEALVQALGGAAALGGGGGIGGEAPTQGTPTQDAPTQGEVERAQGGGKPEQAGDKPTPKTYTVKAGDTLSSIARRHGTTVDALYERNKDVIGPDRNKIKPGQVLELPDGANAPTQGGGGQRNGRTDRGRGQGNRGQGNGNGGGDRVGQGGGADGAPAGEAPRGSGPSPEQREQLQARRTELQARRTRLNELLSQHGGRAGTTSAVKELEAIDRELRDVNSALNGRGN